MSKGGSISQAKNEFIIKNIYSIQFNAISELNTIFFNKMVRIKNQKIVRKYQL